MNKDGDITILHLEMIEWFAEKLIGINLAIYYHEYDQLCFGSWEIILGTRHNRMRIIYDGRDNNYSMHYCKVSDSGTIENWNEYKNIIGTDENTAIEIILETIIEYYKTK